MFLCLLSCAIKLLDNSFILPGIVFKGLLSRTKSMFFLWLIIPYYSGKTFLSIQLYVLSILSTSHVDVGNRPYYQPYVNFWHCYLSCYWIVLSLASGNFTHKCQSVLYWVLNGDSPQNFRILCVALRIM